MTSYRRFRHGEAIGYGMMAAAHISKMRGLLNEADADRLHGLIHQMGPLPPVANLKISDALDIVARDKKVVNRRLHFVLARGIGNTEIVSDLHTRELVASMRAIGMRQ